MRLKKFINEEQTNLVATSQEIIDVVNKTWKKAFPKSFVSATKGVLSGDGFAIATFTLGKDKSEWENGISENDPLSLTMVFENKSGEIITEFSANSLSISPDNPYMAFGRKKINVRKFRTKDLKALEKKLTMAFGRVKDTVKDALAKDEFSVYREDRIKMIKSKV